jgi:filamentous hemagglutinin family protein
MKKISLFLLTLPVSAIATLASLTIAVAQEVIPDGTVSTTVIPSPDGKNFTINDGTPRGTNLFHSFKEFSVPTGGSANFNNAANIQNIISRVTGGSVSTIDGLIKANGTANLFLLNPAGIIFGPNASLQIGGSFLGSTANSLLFKDGFEFSATDLQPQPLLTISIPIGLRYRDNPQNITTQSAFLGVPQGNSLALVGGNVNLNGGGLVAQGGRIELGGLSVAGTVGLNGDGSLSFPVGVPRGDVSLTNRAIVGVPAGEGGNIAVHARNLELSGGSLFSAGILSGLGTPGAQAGDITIDATDRVRIEGTTNFVGGIFNLTGFGSNSSNITEPGNAGNIVINTGTLEGNGYVAILSSTNGQGNAGKIIITAKDKVSLTGESANTNSFASVGGSVGSLGTGNGADVVIDTPSLSLFNAAIQTSTSGQGNAGNILLKVSEFISLSGASLGADTFGRGNSGNIVIDAPNAAVSFDGANTVVSTFVGRASTGKGGDITIKARNLSATNGASLSTSTFGRAEAGRLANAGNIQINVLEDVSFTGGSSLNSSTFGQGNAGNVTVSAGGKISFDGTSSDSRTGIFSIVGTGAEGNGGNIELRGRSVSVTNGAQLISSTLGKGDAGSVRINATDTISFAGVNPLFGFPSGIFSSVGSTGEGKGGDIELQARAISLTDGAQLIASTFGKGDAGSLRINATDIVSFSGVNQINGNPSAAFSTVEGGGVGNGGEINITAGSLELTNGGQLNAFVRDPLGTTPGGNGNAGNIKLNIGDAVTIVGASDRRDVNGNFNSSAIFSDVKSGARGNAGNIEINARSLSLTNGGTISSTNLSNGSAGNITVTTAKDIRLDNKASIQANTRRGEGNISLNARDLILRRNSSITTNATGRATGGNIGINTGNLVALENSNITAKAQQGYGGNIIITTSGGRFLSPDSVISAASEAGPQFNGTVQFNTQPNDPSKGLFELTETVIDPAQQIAQNVCIKGFGSSFTIVGRGGIPTDPNKILSNDNVRVDLVKPAPSTVNSTSTTQKQPSQEPTVKKIIPAQGWIFNEKGEVLLVGYDPTKVGVQRPQPAPTSSCAAVK